MLQLVYFPLCPRSRSIQMAMGELALDFEVGEEKPWTWRQEFLDLNPAGDLPVLIVSEEKFPGPAGLQQQPGQAQQQSGIVCGFYACLEFLHSWQDSGALGNNPKIQPLFQTSSCLQQAETRRMISWFGDKFQQEVCDPLLGEIIYRALAHAGSADMDRLQSGKDALKYHMSYLEYLLGKQENISGRHVDLSDIVAAAYISTIDYTGQLAWKNTPKVREWYARMKSRPAMRPLLAVSIPGFPPPSWYADPDF